MGVFLSAISQGSGLFSGPEQAYAVGLEEP